MPTYLRKTLSPLAFAILLLPLLFSCEPDEEVLSDDPNVLFEFSSDTLFFDTLFTSVGSISQRLKIYNPSKNALRIDRIALGNQVNNPYSTIINGVESSSVQNLTLLGGDSLLILVKITIDPSDETLPFLVQDSLVVERNGQTQDVKLVSWGQNANFFRSGLQVLNCNATWEKGRPYVIFDSLLVPEGCQLTMMPGTRVHFGPNAALFVGGTLTIAGSFEKPVKLTSVRTDASYAEVPGQWDAVYFLPSSSGNTVEWAEVSNANIGFYVGKPNPDGVPEITISSTKIQNMALFGVQSVSADVLMYNSLISRCAGGVFRGSGGGNYFLYHNTLTSVSNDFFREEPSFVLLNFQELADGDLLTEPLNAELINNIIWGNLTEELFIGGLAEASIEINAVGNIFKTQDTNFEGSNLVNTDPLFRSTFGVDFRLDSLGESPAIDYGQPIFGIERDLMDTLRDENPDAGAYEFVME